MIPFPLDRGTGTFKQKVWAINPNGKVPVLIDDGLLLWDSLAICEYLAEQHPDQALWPQDIKQRARARCITAEMHSGFPTLRNACAMNIRANLADVGRRLWQDNAELRQDVARIEQIWSERPESHRFLCGEFSIADAFYAPVVMRLMTYALPVSESTRQYMQTMLQHAATCCRKSLDGWRITRRRVGELFRVISTETALTQLGFTQQFFLIAFDLITATCFCLIKCFICLA